MSVDDLAADDGVGETPSAADPPRGWLTAGVGSVGAASLFSDSGHEIVTAVLPSFLTTVLHSSAAALGLIEGFSDALVGVAKVIGGPLANDPRRRRRLATGGYVGTAVATGAIGLAATVWQAGYYAPSRGRRGASARQRGTRCCRAWRPRTRTGGRSGWSEPGTTSAR